MRLTQAQLLELTDSSENRQRDSFAPARTVLHDRTVLTGGPSALLTGVTFVVNAILVLECFWLVHFRQGIVSSCQENV